MCHILATVCRRTTNPYAENRLTRDEKGKMQQIFLTYLDPRMFARMESIERHTSTWSVEEVKINLIYKSNKKISAANL